MSRVTPLLTVLALTLAACCPAPKPTACPPCARAAVVKPQPQPRPKPAPALRPRPAPDPPVMSKPPRRLSSNCQAPLPLTREVSRLLITAAAHSTRSSACVDGPGTRVAVDRILVCPKRVRADRAEVEASYRVGRFAEGDTRMCGARPGGCAWLKPRFSEHLTTFRFAGKAKVLRIQLPKKVPGFPDMTALDKKHKGGCYGESAPFAPVDVKVQ